MDVPFGVGPAEVEVARPLFLGAPEQQPEAVFAVGGEPVEAVAEASEIAGAGRGGGGVEDIHPGAADHPASVRFRQHAAAAFRGERAVGESPGVAVIADAESGRGQPVEHQFSPFVAVLDHRQIAAGRRLLGLRGDRRGSGGQVGAVLRDELEKPGHQLHPVAFVQHEPAAERPVVRVVEKVARRGGEQCEESLADRADGEERRLAFPPSRFGLSRREAPVGCGAAGRFAGDKDRPFGRWLRHGVGPHVIVAEIQRKVEERDVARHRVFAVERRGFEITVGEGAHLRQGIIRVGIHRNLIAEPDAVGFEERIDLTDEVVDRIIARAGNQHQPAPRTHVFVELFGEFRRDRPRSGVELRNHADHDRVAHQLVARHLLVVAEMQLESLLAVGGDRFGVEIGKSLRGGVLRRQAEDRDGGVRRRAEAAGEDGDQAQQAEAFHRGSSVPREIRYSSGSSVPSVNCLVSGSHSKESRKPSARQRHARTNQRPESPAGVRNS